MRPAPRVYGVGLHLDKSGLALPFLGRRSPGNLWVTVWVRNLSTEGVGCARVPSSAPSNRRGNGSSNHQKGGLVSTRRREPIPDEPRRKTANQEWKARWDDLLAGSIMFAVAVHAAAFAFWPSWDTLDLSLDSDLELLETEIAWISFYTMPSSGGGVAAASLALIEEPDSLPPGAEAEAETTLGGSALTGVAFSGGLYERLLGRGGGGPVPTVVEPEPVSAPLDLGDSSADTPEEEGEGVRVIVEDPAITDLALRLETSTLDLERLTGIRPELALPGTTMWLLIRNPVEVQEFMRASALRGAAEGEGEVDVTVWIDERGSVEWSEITRSSGRQEIDEIALALFDEVVSFRPAQDRGVRVSMSVIFSVAFPW